MAKIRLNPLVGQYIKHNVSKFMTEQTSIHALNYIGNSRIKLWQRLFYAVAFVTVFIVSVNFATNVYIRWESTPVIVALNGRISSIRNIPFPAVTICNMNQVKASRVSHYPKGSVEYAMLRRLCLRPFNFSSYENLKPNITFPKFIIKNSQSCNEMTVFCSFGSVVRPCSNLFREILIDEGLCCVFNALHPDFLYKGDYEFVRDYTTLEGRIPVNWNPETGYPEKVPNRFYPRLGSGAGISRSLTVVLFADKNEYFCTSSNGPGFKVQLHNPVDMPSVKEVGVQLKLGYQSRIRVDLNSMEALSTVRSIQPEARQCVFNDEQELLYFKYNTRLNCEKECDAKNMLENCNCIPYYLPRIYKNATLCNLKNFNCVIRATLRNFNSENSACKSRCMDGCFQFTYFSALFATPFAQERYGMSDAYFRNLSKDFIKKELALLQVYYDEEAYRSNIMTPYTDFTNYLSSTGGILSVLTGFSVVSLAEIFYFAIMRPLFDYFLKRHPLGANREGSPTVKTPITPVTPWTINKVFVIKTDQDKSNEIIISTNK